MILYNQLNILNSYTMNSKHLKIIERILLEALKQRNRVFVLRMDVHFPPHFPIDAITTFLKRFIQRERNHGYAPTYVAMREYTVEAGIHYHIILFLNGYKTRRIESHIKNARDVMDRMVELSIAEHPELDCSRAMIYPCDDNQNGIMVYRDDKESIDAVLRQASYLAKTDQKPIPTSIDRVCLTSNKRRLIPLMPLYPRKWRISMSYVQRRTDDLFNNYIRKHRRVLVLPFIIQLPEHMDRHEIMHQFLKRFNLFERRMEYDPCYFCYHVDLDGVDTYGCIWVTDANKVSLHFCHFMNAGACLNRILDPSNPKPSNLSPYLHPVDDTKVLLLDLDREDRNDVRYEIRNVFYMFIDNMVKLPHERSFMCSFTPKLTLPTSAL